MTQTLEEIVEGTGPSFHMDAYMLFEENQAPWQGEDSRWEPLHDVGWALRSATELASTNTTGHVTQAEAATDGRAMPQATYTYLGIPAPAAKG